MEKKKLFNVADFVKITHHVQSTDERFRSMTYMANGRYNQLEQGKENSNIFLHHIVLFQFPGLFLNR